MTNKIKHFLGERRNKNEYIPLPGDRGQQQRVPVLRGPGLCEHVSGEGKLPTLQAGMLDQKDISYVQEFSETQ